MELLVGVLSALHGLRVIGDQVGLPVLVGVTAVHVLDDARADLQR